ncbi:DUF397 domain-containing protein [Streptomyces olivaceus]
MNTTQSRAVQPHWFKSSYSGGSGGDRTGVAPTSAGIHIRGSKAPAHGILTVHSTAWAAFLDLARGNRPESGPDLKTGPAMGVRHPGRQAGRRAAPGGPGAALRASGSTPRASPVPRRCGSAPSPCPGPAGTRRAADRWCGR